MGRIRGGKRRGRKRSGKRKRRGVEMIGNMRREILRKRGRRIRRGWGSLWKGIEGKVIEEKGDSSEGMVGREVGRKRGDGDLGDVFRDGGGDKGGLGYWMKRGCLGFMGKEKMEGEGYGEYLEVVK